MTTTGTDLSPDDEHGAAPRPGLSGRVAVGVAIAAGIIGVAGVVAVFRTTNELGSATLIAVALYLAISASLGRFPRFKFGDNEFDPEIAIQARRVSKDAKNDSADAKEGLADTIDRVSKLEAALAGGTGTGAASDASTDPGATPPSPQAREPITRTLDPQLVDLAREYNEVRWTMPSGSGRTARMTRIVDRMIEVSAQLTTVDVPALVTSPDRGLRLVGVAYLNAHPDVGAVDLLADTVLSEDKPFNEYWGLLTLRKVLTGHCEALTPTLRRRLQSRREAMSPGTDRAQVIAGILADCP